MTSLHNLGGPERIVTLAREWAEDIVAALAERGLAPGTAQFLDEAERVARARLSDLRTDYPYAGALALLTIRDEIKSRGGA